MTLQQVKEALNGLSTIQFQLPDGNVVPSHFHVTEVGEVTKHFIDCGGTIRHEKKANFQLWNANDYDHQLHPEKLVHIISLSQEVLGLGNLEVEVEYQGNTIEKFGLDFDGTSFLLTSKHTDCLAKEKCGIPPQKQKIRLSKLQEVPAGCTPGGTCC